MLNFNYIFLFIISKLIYIIQDFKYVYFYRNLFQYMTIFIFLHRLTHTLLLYKEYLLDQFF